MATRLSIKQPQTPELAYDCFRTVMSAVTKLVQQVFREACLFRVVMGLAT